MKLYTVITIDQGKRIRLSVLADSAEDAAQRVTRQGGAVLNVAPRATRREKRFPQSLFLQELIALLDAGLVVTEAIETLRESHPDPLSRLVLDTLIQKLYEGVPLSQAMAALPAIFPPLLVNMVKSAEHTSDLSSALARFRSYDTLMTTLRKRIKGILLYPTIVIAVGSAVLIFLLGFIIPRFASVFEGMKAPSASAQLILWWGKLVETHGSLLFIAMVAMITSLIAALRSPLLRQQALSLALHIPQLRHQYQLSIWVRFYRTLGLLLLGGLPVPQALSLSREVLPTRFHPRIEQVIRDVEAGESLAGMLEKQQMTTPIASRLLRVGERTSELPGMCERIAAFYDDALERAIDTFGKVFEPLLMTVVGGIVGLVVFLLYMPIFELAGGIN